MLLLELTKLDRVIGDPVQQVDGDGDRLPAAQKGPLRNLVHLVQPALMMPADVATNEHIRHVEGREFLH